MRKQSETLKSSDSLGQGIAIPLGADAGNFMPSTQPPHSDPLGLLLNGMSREKPDEFNAWRSDNPKRLIILRDVKFEHRTFVGFDFTNVQFMSISFGVCKFEKCRFHDVSFRESDWNLSSFFQCEMQGMRAPEIVAHRAKIVGCDLSMSDLRGSTFDMSQWEENNVTEGSLSLSRFMRSEFRHCNLSDANLRRGDFSESMFENSNLENVDLRSTNLTDASLKSCSLNGVQLWNVQIGNWCLESIECAEATFDEQGENVVLFGEGQFERIYGNSLKLVLTFPGGLVMAELLAIPAMIEVIKRDLPGCAVGVSSINELGGATEIVFTTSRAPLVAQSNLALVKAELEGRLSELRERLRSRDIEIMNLNSQMGAIVNKLVERLSMVGNALTFNGPVAAGSIGGDRAVVGNSNVVDNKTNDDAIASQIAELVKLAQGLDAERKKQVIAALEQASQGEQGGRLSKFQQAARSIRNICEGAIGSLGATAILFKLNQWGVG